MANLVKKWPLLALLWIDMTIADDVTPKEESPNPVQNEVIAIPNIGEATVKIEEVGEPIAKPTLVTISLKCKNAAKEVELENDLGVCSFEKAYFSRSKKHLIVEYNSSVMLDGELACKKKNTKEYSITCK